VNVFHRAWVAVGRTRHSVGAKRESMSSWMTGCWSEGCNLNSAEVAAKGASWMGPDSFAWKNLRFELWLADGRKMEPVQSSSTVAVGAVDR
jgi:hypothetical protein